ncbi:MAG: GNAT family N-acetyltransferase [Candidatus Omnitrophica bacterium]|nr:GNAT family N-acetyltransferase [Candidatus Omnitrophota bacterium]
MTKQSGDVQIRKFQKQDAQEVKKLIEGIMHSEFSDVLGAFPANDLENLSDYYGKAGEAFFVAISNSKIVGSIGVKKEDDRAALIRRIFVFPEFRGRQIGKSLLDKALDFCKEVGYQEVIFKTTSKMKEAIKLFEDNGFHEKVHLKLGNTDLYKLTYFIRENSPFSR